ncbi:hypothetical protein, partial, partial [Parasitella parasitica]
MSLQEARATDRCRTCGAHNFSAGPHECYIAVRSGSPPKSSQHRFQMMNLVPSSDTVSGSASSSSAPASVVEDRYCEYHENTTHDTSDCKVLGKVASLGFSHSSSSVVSAASSSSAVNANQPSAGVSASSLLDADIHKLSMHDDDTMDVD